MKTHYPGPSDDPVWASERIEELESINADLLAALVCISRGLTNGQKERGETLQSIAEAAIAKVEVRLGETTGRAERHEN